MSVREKACLNGRGIDGQENTATQNRNLQAPELGELEGSMRMAGAASRIIVTYEENYWYSPEVKEVIKSELETLTVVMLPTVTSITRTREERTLKSYS